MFTIRKATVADYELIHMMAKEVFPATYKDILSPEQLDYMMEWMYAPWRMCASKWRKKGMCIPSPTKSVKPCRIRLCAAGQATSCIPSSERSMFSPAYQGCALRQFPV